MYYDFRSDLDSKELETRMKTFMLIVSLAVCPLAANALTPKESSFVFGAIRQPLVHQLTTNEMRKTHGCCAGKRIILTPPAFRFR